MDTEAKETNKEPTSSVHDDVGTHDLLATWAKVLRGLEINLRHNYSVFASDLSLSFKALLVSIISILMLVGLGLVLWVTLLAGLFYGLTLLGVNWIWSFLLIIAINLAALIMAKRILSSALPSINLQTTRQLFSQSTGKTS